MNPKGAAIRAITHCSCVKGLDHLDSGVSCNLQAVLVNEDFEAVYQCQVLVH